MAAPEEETAPSAEEGETTLIIVAISRQFRLGWPRDRPGIARSSASPRSMRRSSNSRQKSGPSPAHVRRPRAGRCAAALYNLHAELPAHRRRAQPARQSVACLEAHTITSRWPIRAGWALSWALRQRDSERPPLHLQRVIHDQGSLHRARHGARERRSR